MEASLENWINLLAKLFDDFRSRILKFTLQIQILRSIFCNRSLRLLTLFLISFSISLTVSVFFPLWVLLIGPVIYGVPHIFASIRYFHYAVSGPEQFKNELVKKKTYFILCLLTAFVALYRLTSSAHLFNMNFPVLSEWRGSTYIEVFGVLITFTVASWIYRKSLYQNLRGILLITPLFLGYWLQPFYTIGLLILIHNFVAFFYWIISSKNEAEKRVAYFATAAISTTTLLIFFGLFDPLYKYLTPSTDLPFAQLRVENLGQMILPWSSDYLTWLHTSIAYGFGQMLHYFVWLKVIGDQFHYHEMPTSFRQSFRLLQNDFGKIGVIRVLGIVIMSTFIWIFFRYPQARLIYFCLAAFHGFLEIAGLALAEKKFA